ncbi:MAG: hypothetical protein HY897_19975 [Deltaproteobacteria bacterium]|nr:hypothetical protein [Deltaproteobacteria bacterium]
MNVYFALASSFAAGCLYALAGADKVRTGDLVGRWFLATVVYHSVIFVPVFLYATVFYPDWSVMYFFQPLRTPPVSERGWLFSAAALVLTFATMLAGFLYGRKRSIEGKGASAATIVTFIYAISFAVMAVLFRRTLFAGTLEQYGGVGAKFIFARPLGWAMCFYLISIPAGIAFWKKVFSRKPSHM